MSREMKFEAPYTVQTVRDFQAKYSLTVDGIAGYYNTIQAMFWN